MRIQDREVIRDRAEKLKKSHRIPGLMVWLKDTDVIVVIEKPPMRAA